MQPRPYVAPVVQESPADSVDQGPIKVNVEGSGYTNPDLAPVAGITAFAQGYDQQPSYCGTKYAGGYSHRRRAEGGAPRTVHVSGYTRRDGTYVHSYSRRAPRR